MYRVVVTYKAFTQHINNLVFDEFLTSKALSQRKPSISLPTLTIPNERYLVFQFKTKEGAQNAKKRIKATGRLLRVHVYED